MAKVKARHQMMLNDSEYFMNFLLLVNGVTLFLVFENYLMSHIDNFLIFTPPSSSSTTRLKNALPFDQLLVVV